MLFYVNPILIYQFHLHVFLSIGRDTFGLIKLIEPRRKKTYKI